MTTYVVSSLLFVALLMNVLATYSVRGEERLQLLLGF